MDRRLLAAVHDPVSGLQQKEWTNSLMRSKPTPTLRSSRSLLRLASDPPPRKLAALEDPVHCLVIPRSSDGADGLLRFSAAEQRHWLDEAARHDVCLIVISAPDALELYSTAAHRLLAFRPALAELQIRLALQPGVGKLRTRQLSGSAAAGRLLDRAAGLLASNSAEHEPDVRASALLIHNASALASALDTLGSTLGSLCWAASSVAQRVHDEVGVRPPPGTAFEARRIVDEELARWRSELAQLRRTLRPSVPPTERALASYRPEEPGSLVRIKIPKNLLGAEELGAEAGDE